MGELCGILGVLGLVILIVAAVGHGIWLIIAWAFRQIFRGGGGGRFAPPNYLDETAVTAKKLEELYREALIDRETFQSVLEAIHKHEPKQRAMIPLATRLMKPPQRPVSAPPVAVPSQTMEPVREFDVTSAALPPIPLEFSDKVIQPPPLPPPPPPRAPQFVQSIAAPPLQRPRPAVRAAPPPPPRPQRKPFSEILKHFMEESNIRWGELVGGLLIIGCSIALVLTFWETIASQPWLRFFLFTAVTSAVFGAGLYTEHRWKLPNTSRGLLLIGTLMVPLTFLAFSRGATSAGAMAMVQEVVALGLFTWLVWAAGKVLTVRWAIPLVIGVLGASAVAILVGRLVAADHPAGQMMLLLGLLAVAVYVVSNGWVLAGARKLDEVDGPTANRMLLFLGATTFALLLPLGLLAAKVQDWMGTARQIAPILSLASAPMMAMGLLLWRKARGAGLGGVQTAGAAIAVLAGFVLLGGVVLAWPDPGRMIAAALLAFGILSAIAIFYEIPSAHLLALPCLGLVYVLGFHLIQPASHRDHIGWNEQSHHLAQALLSASSGTSLLGLVLLLGAATDWLKRRKRGEAPFFLMGAVGFMAISLALINVHGFGRQNDHGAAWAYLGYAILTGWLAWRTRRSEATSVAIGLLAAAVVQAVVFKFGTGAILSRCMLAALVTGSILISAMVLTWVLSRREHDRLFIRPLGDAGLISSLVALALLVFVLIVSDPLPRLDLMGLRSFWIAGLLLAISIVYVRTELFRVFQVALAGAVVLTVGAFLQNKAWFATAAHPILHPWTMQSAATALALLSLAWIILRIGLRRATLPDNNPVARLMYPDWPSVDGALGYLALAVFLMMALFAIAPAIGHELGTRGQADAPGSSWLANHAGGIRAWVLFAAASAALIGSLWIQFRRAAVLALTAGVAGACAIWAASFDATTSSASALRWSLAALLLLGSIPSLWRDFVAQLANGAGWPGLKHGKSGLSWQYRALLLSLTVLPILAITFYSAATALVGVKLVGPAAESFFGRTGSSISYLVPLLMMIVVFIAHAYREHSPKFAFAAALLLNVTVTLGYMLWLVSGQRPIGMTEWIHLIQFNAIASAIFALGWIGVVRWRYAELYGPTRRFQPHTLMLVQVGLPLIALAGLLGIFELWLINDATTIPPAARQVAGLWGVLAWICAGAAELTVIWSADRRLSAGRVCAALALAGSLAAMRCVGTTPAENWFAYHALLSASALAAWCMLGFGAYVIWAEQRSRGGELENEGLRGAQSNRRFRKQITIWTVVLGAGTLLLSLRAIMDDPARPWWTVYGMLALSPLAVALAFWTMRSSWLYPAGILLNIAASIGLVMGNKVTLASPLLGLIQLNILVLGLSGLAFLVLELWILRPLRSQVVHVGITAFHHFAAIVSLLAIGAVTAILLMTDIFGRPAVNHPILTWGAPAAALAIMMASLWDRDSRYSLIGLYVMGLVVAASVLQAFHFRLDNMVVVGVVVLAGYSVLVSYLYNFRSSLAQFGETVGIPPRDNWPARDPGWVAAITMLQSVIVFVLAFFAVQFLDRQLSKVAVAAAAFTMAVAVGLLAREEREERLKRATLLLGLFGAILWGWAWLPRYGPDLFLNRMVIVMIAMAGVSILYAVGLVKILRRENAWTAAAKRLVPFIGVGTAISLVLVLAGEVYTYRPSLGAPMALWAFLAVVAALLAMAVAAMVCAIVPGKDPLDLSERGRQVYVYGTEVLLVLLFVHIKLVFPDLLNIGIWTRYWPIIVMFLAFLGIGLSELFRRQGRPVLAEPLEKTSLLLPFLPVISFWMLTGVWKHEQNVNYALVLLLAGAAYGTLAVLRRSFAFGLISALAGNGALWYLLSHSQSFGFFQHPQLWLIPVALSVLAAGYLNKERLSGEQMRTIRYVCLMAIYASSTADIMINGVNRSLGLAMLLALLAVAGVMAGIMMRVQSFLLLGTLFLLVAIATMIQYAAHQVDRNWPWLVAGIVLGSGIIVVFALFEKKRTEMLALVDGLKEWQG